MTEIKKSENAAADAAQGLGTHPQIGGQFAQGNHLQQVGAPFQQGFVTLLRRRGIAVQQPFVNLGQHVFGQHTAQSFVCGVGAVEGFEPFARDDQRRSVAHRLDRHLRRGIDTHRDIVADELPGKGIPDDMLPARGIGMHIAERTLHDQSRTMAAKTLRRKVFAACETAFKPLRTEELRQSGKLRLRDMPVEIHAVKITRRFGRTKRRY